MASATFRRFGGWSLGALGSKSPIGNFHLLTILLFSLLALKGIYHYWTYFIIFSRGLNQMEENGLEGKPQGNQRVLEASFSIGRKGQAAVAGKLI